MGIKNTNFYNADYDDYAKFHASSEYEAARANGIRKAQQNLAQADDDVPAIVTPPPTSRKPVVIPQTENGDPDYRALDLPTFLRRRSPAPTENTRAPAPPVQATEHQSSDQTGGVTRISGAASSFIAKMKSAANEKLGCVDFFMPEETVVAFRRFSDTISLGDREPSDDIILAMLEMGKSDFGSIEVYGSPEFIANAVRVAIDNGIVLQNKEYAKMLSESRRNKMRA